MIPYVWYWSPVFPDYAQRLRMMGSRGNLRNAFFEASFMTLIPKEQQ